MFDVGFTEVTLIAIIALVVVGPKRLPQLAKTAGFWVGRARKTLSDVKRDIDREMDQAELRDVRDSIESAKSEIDTATSNVAESVSSVGQQIDKDIEDGVGNFERSVSDSTPKTTSKSGDA